MGICNFVFFDFSVFCPLLGKYKCHFLFDRDLEPVGLRRLLKFHREISVISQITAFCNTIKWKTRIFYYFWIHNGLTVKFSSVITSE